MKQATLIKTLSDHLRVALEGLPDGFSDTFQYTRTGRNLTHPIIWGSLIKASWALPDVDYVGVDYRLNNRDGAKFQPDIVGFSEPLGDAPVPLFAIDYESPNSSDARIPNKDIRAYQVWRQAERATFPYVIVTTLPDRHAPEWELRYTYGDGCNADYRGCIDAVRQNPLRFWLSQYQEALETGELSGVIVLNISGKTVKRVKL